MDYYERALYNHILASQNPENGMMTYFVPLRMGTKKQFSDSVQYIHLLRGQRNRKSFEVCRTDLQL